MGFERRELAGGVRALVNEPLGALGVLAAFLERTGGESDPPYDTLDVSLSVRRLSIAIRVLAIGWMRALRRESVQR